MEESSVTENMQAAVIGKWGGPAVVEYGTVNRPRPGEGHALIRVEACALNYLDILVREGLNHARLPLPHVGGCDIVGVVEELEGPGPSVGTRVVVDPAFDGGVIGAGCWGGLAEYAVVPAGNALPLPGMEGGSDPGDAHPAPRFAALPMAYGTAHRMLFTRAALAAGETVVVLGAAGGVGVACVQLASQAGARVIACSTSDTKLNRLRLLGAAEVVNPTREVLRRRVRQLTESGADVVVDFIGQETWPESLRCLAPGGRMVTCGATTGPDAVTDLRYVYSRELAILGSDGWTGDDLRALLAMVASGKLEPVVDEVFPLADARRALGRVEDRQVLGKVVVTPDRVGHLGDG